MKKVAGTLKLDQAQFRELESFAKFGSDLDPATKLALDKGHRNVELLKQQQYSPMNVEEQVAVLYCGVKGLLLKLPVDKVEDFQEDYLRLLRRDHPDVLARIAAGEMDADIEEVLKKTAAISIENLAPSTVE